MPLPISVEQQLYLFFLLTPPSLIIFAEQLST
jgi:hypothetical protein